ncbi:MAG: hypothetical protein A2020_04510 [Lentisphaerae bacterium GWF2_45_14]|nr:MAG: hypothetical protein A2020_04510 [Lentisphaerae bacterium GWF2_45_14]
MSKAKESLWKKVSTDLKVEIERGLFNKSKFPTLREICIQYEVSGITARRVIAELAAQGLIKKSTKTGSSVIKRDRMVKEIFLIGPANNNQSIIYSQINQGIIEEAAKNNIEIKTVSSDFILNNLNTIKELNLIAPASEGVLFEKLKDQALWKIVKYHSITKDKTFSTVRSDLKNAAVIAMKYLLGQGHKRIAFITGKSGYWFVSRLEAYTKTLHENDIDLDLRLIKGVEKDSYEETASAVKSLMELSAPPTAIFAATDIHALNILSFCRNSGIKVPEKLALCGFDNLPESEFYSPPLTTVDTNWKTQGAEAVRLFRNEDFLNGKIIDVKIKPELVVRQSS